MGWLELMGNYSIITECERAPAFFGVSTQNKVFHFYFHLTYVKKWEVIGDHQAKALIINKKFPTDLKNILERTTMYAWQVAKCAVVDWRENQMAACKWQPFSSS
jgi:hypothetical protein